jgi:hypothetical protein
MIHRIWPPTPPPTHEKKARRSDRINRRGRERANVSEGRVFPLPPAERRRKKKT